PETQPQQPLAVSLLRLPRPLRSTLFPYTTLFRSLKPWEQRERRQQEIARELQPKFAALPGVRAFPTNPPSLGQSARSKPVEFVIDRKSTRLNSSHVKISYAVFCLKKKIKPEDEME